MPFTIPPEGLPLFDEDGRIDPQWYQFFSRIDIRLIPRAMAVVTVSAGTPTLQNSVNVASITDTGTGRLTVTFEKAFASANYAPLVTVTQPGATALFSQTALIAAGSVELECINWATGAFADPTAWAFAAFGNL